MADKEKRKSGVPDELREEFSMGGLVDIVENFLYFNRGANRKYKTYSIDLVNEFINEVKKKNCLHYPETDLWLYQALEKYEEHIENKKVLIIGSTEPCYEACALHYGAKEVTMVEYQTVTSEHPQITTITADQFSKMDEEYDAVISISSVEHSGLGRYGDPINPDGDIKAMKELYNNLKDGGLCFLAVPIGIDQIIWNAHRVYGRHRLPKLIESFETIETFGLIDSDYGVNEVTKRRRGSQEVCCPFCGGESSKKAGCHQPILVLKKLI